ncbi:hypothetical protein KFK09_011507 [Dendrobium nobile]|uniref:Uncharacterized protein n=1 Tax=Dendrobium nobile TaxID=94219 RepID=A0A8T3BD26_DENNO|nr:hypothetical protein KFK09_011507 [Dendrobium nobile]
MIGYFQILRRNRRRIVCSVCIGVLLCYFVLLNWRFPSIVFWVFYFLLDAMGRKKNRPVRSGSLVSEVDDPQSSVVIEQSLGADCLCTTAGDNANFRKPFFIEIESCASAFDEHFDVADVSLDNIISCLCICKDEDVILMTAPY